MMEINFPNLIIKVGLIKVLCDLRSFVKKISTTATEKQLSIGCKDLSKKCNCMTSLFAFDCLEITIHF